MPPVSNKNLALSPIVADLGLGDKLVQQVQDETDARKKKLDMLQSQSIFTTAAKALFGGMGT